MAKTINITEIVKEYLLFKEIFDSKKVDDYQRSLKNSGKIAEQDVIQLFVGYVNELSSIPVIESSLNKSVRFDVYLNSIEKDFIAKGGKVMKPAATVEYTNFVEKLLSSVPSAKNDILTAFDSQDVAKKTRQLKLAVGKYEGKQLFTVANKIAIASALSGYSTNIASKTRENNNLKDKNEKLLQQLQDANAQLVTLKVDSNEYKLLKEQVNKIEQQIIANDESLSYLVKSIASSDGKRSKRIEKKTNEIDEKVDRIEGKVDEIHKSVVRVKPAKKSVRAFLALGKAFMIALAVYGGGRFVQDLVEPKPVIVQQGDSLHDELLSKIETAKADGVYTDEEITSINNTIVKFDSKETRDQYTDFVGDLVDASKLQGIKNDVLILANAFNIAGDNGLTDKQLEERIVNDNEFRAEVMSDIAQYAKQADYNEIKDIVAAVGSQLEIDPQNKNESNKEFKDRIIEQIETIQTENIELTAKNQDLEEINKNYFLRIIELSSNIQESAEVIKELKETIITLESKIDKLQGQIDQLIASSGDSEAVKVLKEQLQEAIAAKEAAEAALEQKTQESDEKIAALESTIAELEAQIADKDKQIQELENKVKTLEEKLQSTTSQEEINKLNSEIAELNKKIVTLESENAQLEETLGQAEGSLEQANKTIDAKNKEIEDLKAEIAQKDKDLADANNKVANLTEQLNSANKTVDDLTTQLADLTIQLDDVTAERDQYKSDWEDLAAKYDQLGVDFENISKLYNDKVKECNELIAKLNASVSPEEAESLRQEIAALKTEIAEAEKLAGSLAGRVAYFDVNLQNFAAKFNISGATSEEILSAILAKYGVVPVQPDVSQDADEKGFN